MVICQYVSKILNFWGQFLCPALGDRIHVHTACIKITDLIFRCFLINSLHYQITKWLDIPFISNILYICPQRW
jgi:hypothetical protein